MFALQRLVALGLLVLVGGATHAAPPRPSVPDDLWESFELEVDGEPWLDIAPGCATASIDVLGPFRPFVCFPPLASTVGVAADGRLLSFESADAPGCGEGMPVAIERRIGARTMRVPLLAALPRGVDNGSDEGLAMALRVSFAESMRALGEGFTAADEVVGERARMVSGDLAVTAAVVLGPPLDGQILWIDLESKSLVLSALDRATVLGRIPPKLLQSGRPAISEVVATSKPDRLVVRFEGLSGGPCDPARLARLDVKVPAEHLGATGFPRPVGARMRSCRGGDVAACVRLCDDGYCRPHARLFTSSGAPRGRLVDNLIAACRKDSALDCVALREVGSTICREDGADAADCQRIDSALGVGVMVKGPPQSTEVWRRLAATCDKGDSESCAELLRVRASGAFRVPRDVAVKARERYLEVLTRRCAYADAACATLETVKGTPIGP